MITQRSDATEAWEELELVYRQGLEMLAGLDRLELYHAGAYLSMTLELMRQRHPMLVSCESDTPKSSPPHDP